MPRLFADRVCPRVYNATHNSLQAHVSLRRYTPLQQIGYTSNMAVFTVTPWDSAPVTRMFATAKDVLQSYYTTLPI